MTTICGNVLAAIVSHCQADAPMEACGIVAELIGDETSSSQRMVGMVNRKKSPTEYAFGYEEHRDVWAALDRAGEWPAMIYHSHTATAPVPSGMDVRGASEPNSVYLIIQTAERLADVVVRGWRISWDGTYAEVPVELGCCATHSPVDPMRGYLGNPT